MELSNKIRRFRFEKDEMTQKQLAARVGVSRQTINAIENCKHAPKIDVAIRIADVFGVLVDGMFQFHYDEKPERRPNVTSVVPTRPTHDIKRVPQALSEEVELIQPVEPSEQSSSGQEPQDEKVLLASLRNMVG